MLPVLLKKLWRIAAAAAVTVAAVAVIYRCYCSAIGIIFMRAPAVPIKSLPILVPAGEGAMFTLAVFKICAGGGASAAIYLCVELRSTRAVFCSSRPQINQFLPPLSLRFSLPRGSIDRQEISEPPAKNPPFSRKRKPL